MEAYSTSVKIDSILFDNTETKVLIKGQTIKDHLSYNTELFISFSELNLLLNELQQRNQNVYVTDLFEEELIGNDYYQTHLTTEKLENSIIDLNLFSLASTKKLIRA